eukprot:5904664-Pyramimonas_sp.AAC.1
MQLSGPETWLGQTTGIASVTRTWLRAGNWSVTSPTDFEDSQGSRACPIHVLMFRRSWQMH